MIKIIEMGEGRQWQAEDETDKAIVLKFGYVMSRWDKNRTNKNKKKFRQMWIKVEANCGHTLNRTAGIDRDEVFNG